MAVEQFELGAAAESPTVVGRAWSNEVWRVATTTGVYCIKLFPACMPDHRRKQLADDLAFEQLVLTTGVVPLHAMDQLAGDTSQLSSFDVGRWDRAVHAAARRRLADVAPLLTELSNDLETLRSQRRPMRMSHRDYDPKMPWSAGPANWSSPTGTTPAPFFRAPSSS